MKKVKVTDLASGDIGNNSSLLMINNGLKKATRMSVSSERYVLNLRLSAGVEYEINGTSVVGSSSSSMMIVTSRDTGFSALVLLGTFAPDTHRYVVGNTGASGLSIGVDINGTQKILVYRKTTEGSVFLKNNDTATHWFDVKVF